MAYVGSSSQPSECIFCRAACKNKDFVLSASDGIVVLLNTYPYTTGHLMVSPARHVADLESMSEEELTRLILGVRRCESVLKREYRPHGLNIGINLGGCAGAGMPGHLHVHIVPRWMGDTNFMPVVGEVRVLPEDLARTFDRLRPYFEGP